VVFFSEYYIISLFIGSLLFWTVVPEQYKTKFIIAASFIMLATIQLKFSVSLLFLVLFVYYGARLMQRQPTGRLLTGLILSLVTVLLCFKYMHVLFTALFGQDSGFSKTYMIPLGISYLIFKLIAFIVDVYREEIEEPNLEELLAYIFFVPSFPAGPIESYQNFDANRKKNFDSSFFLAGLRRLTIGYFKKVVLVNLVLHELINKKLYPIITADGVSLELSASIILLFLVGSLVYAYIDLSAYADLAIGFGQLFGYKICENMNFPIFRKNLSDYWNCWHISLSHWCRSNVYFPVLGSSRNNVLALYASFIVMGLWHYLSLNWILWGMWHASGITAYSKWNRFKKKKKLRGKLPAKVAYTLGMLLTMIYSAMGFSFIMLKSTKEAFRLLLAIII
jgi:alginate O-acetyltransferase complex protein AlgI